MQKVKVTVGKQATPATKAATKPAAATNSFNALIAAASKKTKAASNKSAMPVVEVHQEMAENIKIWLEGNALESKGKSLKTLAEQGLIDEGTSILKSQSFDQGKVVKSAKMQGKDKDGVDQCIRITQAAKWLKMGPETEGPIRLKFGDDFERFFKVQSILTLDAEKVASRPGLAERLKEMLGEDVDVITVEQNVVPTEAFLTEAMTNHIVARKWDGLKQEGICKLQKPSFAE